MLLLALAGQATPGGCGPRVGCSCRPAKRSCRGEELLLACRRKAGHLAVVGRSTRWGQVHRRRPHPLVAQEALDAFWLTDQSAQFHAAPAGRAPVHGQVGTPCQAASSRSVTSDSWPRATSTRSLNVLARSSLPPRQAPRPCPSTVKTSMTMSRLSAPSIQIFPGLRYCSRSLAKMSCSVLAVSSARSSGSYCRQPAPRQK